MGATLAEAINIETLMGQEMGQCQLTDEQWKEVCHLLALTPREEMVCRQLCDGHTRATIGKRMDITTRTVRHHMEQIHRKLHVHNRVGVVMRLVQVRDAVSETMPSAPFQPDETGEFVTTENAFEQRLDVAPPR